MVKKLLSLFVLMLSLVSIYAQTTPPHKFEGAL